MNTKKRITITTAAPLAIDESAQTLIAIKERVRRRLQCILDEVTDFDTDLAWKNSRIGLEHNVLPDLKAIELSVKQQKLNKMQLPLFSNCRS